MPLLLPIMLHCAAAACHKVQAAVRVHDVRWPAPHPVDLQPSVLSTARCCPSPQVLLPRAAGPQRPGQPQHAHQQPRHKRHQPPDPAGGCNQRAHRAAGHGEPRARAAGPPAAGLPEARGQAAVPQPGLGGQGRGAVWRGGLVGAWPDAGCAGVCLWSAQCSTDVKQPSHGALA